MWTIKIKSDKYKTERTFETSFRSGLSWIRDMCLMFKEDGFQSIHIWILNDEMEE